MYNFESQLVVLRGYSWVCTPALLLVLPGSPCWLSNPHCLVKDNFPTHCTITLASNRMLDSAEHVVHIVATSLCCFIWIKHYTSSIR